MAQVLPLVFFTIPKFMIPLLFAVGIFWFWLGWKGLLFIITIGLIYTAIFVRNPRLDKPVTASYASDVISEQIDICKDLISKHIEELSLKEQQSVFRGNYGLIEKDRWNKQKSIFVNKVIRPTIRGELVLTEASIGSVIDAAIKQFREKYPQLANRVTLIEDCTPIQYEQECARILIDEGWEARTTIATGDQGADVLATKGALSIVIQCKKYGSNVGNKAVQEVYAAKTFYNVSYAVVVTNAEYSKAAILLANKTGVLLLHHNDLVQLEAKLSSKIVSSSYDIASS